MENQRQGGAERLFFWGRVVFVAVVLCGVWHYLFADRAVVELTAETDTASLFKIYYKDSGGNWSERKMAAAFLRPGQKSYSFRLSNLRCISELRIDPAERKGEVMIHSLTLRQSGYQPIDVVQLAGAGKLSKGPGVTNVQSGELGIRVISNSNDPNLFLSMPELSRSSGGGVVFFRIVLFFALAWLLVAATSSLLPGYSYVAWGMLLVVALVVVMAGISAYNTHPDEGVHVAAARFYVNNFLPPAVGDLRVEGTYSSYGYSRLYSGEIAYFFAGKFARILEPLDIPDYLAFRSFNLALLTILFCCACCSLTWRILLIPLLLSPQIWYIFSYWNSDALALFLTLCTVWQLVAEESSWNRLLTGKVDSWVLLRVGGLAVLLALLFFCKKNFYFFILFVGFFILHQLFFKKIVWSRKVFFVIAGVMLCAATLFGSFRLWNASINDFEFSNRIQEQVRVHAAPLFNPETPFEKQFARLYMKKRGVSFDEMVASRWGERCFRTSVGEYGYTSVPGSFNYYHYMRYSLLFLGVAVVFSVFLKGGWGNITLLLLTVGMGTALTAISFYHSWTVDYQAQGRYLLPVVGMLAVFTCQARKQLENIVTISLAALVFSGALYSFVFVALAGIGKVTSPF